MRLRVAIGALLLSASASSGQLESIRLPEPSGIHAVGTATYEWTDATRSQAYSSYERDKRTIVVQLWYPSQADSNAQPAPYAPLSRDYDHVVTNSRLRTAFSNQVETAPLILVAPGRGMERTAYTTLAEDLASHGYLVAAVDMPEIGYTNYGDGLIVRPSQKFKPPPGMMGGPYEKVDSFFVEPTALGTRDLEFALEELSALNAGDINGRFTNRIDLTRMGIFAHSLGGRIAGSFTARTPQVQAYISMEGIPPRDVRLNGKIKVPTVMLCSSGTLKYAAENYSALIEKRGGKVYMVELKDFGHNSATDLPYISPSSFNYTVDAEIGLDLTRTIVRTFFNEALRGSDQGLANALDDEDQVILSTYEKN